MIFAGDYIYSEERPIFAKNQILDKKDLIVGKTYKIIYSHLKPTNNETILILSPPHLSKDNKWLIDVVRSKSGDIIINRSLADMGVEIYSSRVWNPTNYVVGPFIVKNSRDIKLPDSYYEEVNNV